MAKKKVKKVKKVSKKKADKPQVKLNPKHHQLRKDFEVFAKGVERLEELRTELNNLDTKGYEAEVAAIRSKLKNVSYIPEIEREMRVLRQKIDGGDYGVAPIKSFDDSEIKKKIKDLEIEIKKKRKISVKKQLSKDEKKMLRAIPRLERQLVNFKKFIQEQRAEERRKKELLKKIDPNVNFIVNDKFNLSLNEIKAELAKRLKEKEINVQKQLQDDLDARKKNFELQYKELEDKFEQKYKEKISRSLHNEIKRKFKDVLKSKLEGEKRKLNRENIERLKDKKKELDVKEKRKLKELEKKKKRIKKRLDLEFVQKLKTHEKEVNLEYERKLKKEEKKLRNILDIKESKDFDKKEKELEKGFAYKFAGIMRMKKQNIEKEKQMKEEAERLKKEIGKKKKRLEEKMKRELEMKRGSLNEEKEKIISQLDKEHEKLKNQIKSEKEKQMKMKEAELQADISKKEFERLRDKLVEELGNKKENLEKDYKIKLSSEKDKLKKHFDEEILAKKFALNNMMHERLTSEVMKLHQIHKTREQRETEKITEMKKSIENERGLLSKMKNRFNIKLMKLKTDEKGYRAKVREDLEREKQEAVRNEIRKQSEVMRKKLRHEFDEKLKLEIQAKKAEFEKKKADLALDVQKRARELFG